MNHTHTTPAETVIACKDCGTRGDHYCPADVAREFEYRCQYCEEACDELITVEDKDSSVGYSDTLEVCRNCFERTAAALSPFEGPHRAVEAPQHNTSAALPELTEDEIAYVRMDRTNLEG